MLLDLGCVGSLVLTDAVWDPHERFILSEMYRMPFHSVIGSNYYVALNTPHYAFLFPCYAYIGYFVCKTIILFPSNSAMYGLFSSMIIITNKPVVALIVRLRRNRDFFVSILLYVSFCFYNAFVESRVDVRFLMLLYQFRVWHTFLAKSIDFF